MTYKVRNKYFGDRAFYKKTLSVALPIMVQNGITNFVGLLDNIMVGQIGTEQMSGVAIVNQFLFIFNLAIFGAMAGPGIFTAQFFGKGDEEGVRNTFRLKIIIGLVLSAIGIFVFSAFGKELINIFLKGDSKGFNLASAHSYGMKYMKVMLIGLLPFALEQAYSGTLRECGETVISMKAGISAIFVNLILNYILIFGKLGAPKLGVIGAAYATVVSRCIQFLIVVVWTHTHGNRMSFIIGAFRSVCIPVALVGNMLRKGFPLLVNELLWSAGITMLNQCYSLRGLDAVAAINMASTINNLFNVAFIALGDAVAIIVGQQLGAGEFEEAKDTDRKALSASVLESYYLHLRHCSLNFTIQQRRSKTLRYRLCAWQHCLFRFGDLHMPSILHFAQAEKHLLHFCSIAYFCGALFMWSHIYLVVRMIWRLFRCIFAYRLLILSRLLLVQSS